MQELAWTLWDALVCSTIYTYKNWHGHCGTPWAVYILILCWNCFKLWKVISLLNSLKIVNWQKYSMNQMCYATSEVFLKLTWHYIYIHIFFLVFLIYIVQTYVQINSNNNKQGKLWKIQYVFSPNLVDSNLNSKSKERCSMTFYSYLVDSNLNSKSKESCKRYSTTFSSYLVDSNFGSKLKARKAMQIIWPLCPHLIGSNLDSISK